MNFIFERLTRNYVIQTQAGFKSGQSCTKNVLVQLVEKFNQQEDQGVIRNA